MRVRRLCLFVSLVTAACAGSSPVAPTAAALSLTISPSPVALPTEGISLTWNVIYRETAGVGLRIDRDETLVIDAAGATVVQQQGFWAPNCAQCSGPELRLEAGRSMTVGRTAKFFVSPRPGTLHYTVYFTDEKGNLSSSTVSVPVS